MDRMDTFDRGDSGRRNSNDDYGRRRSDDADPYSNRRVRNRDRSRSPVHIDRYQPDRNNRERPSYYRGRDDAERRRRTPPITQPGIDRYVPGHDQPPPPLVNPLPNPMSLPFQVGFTWFAEWWRVDKQIKEEKERQKTGGRRPIKSEKEALEDRAKEREQIQAAYDSYKEKLQIQMARNFVQEHKGEEWFKERYDPDTRTPLRAQLGHFRRGAYAKWESDLRSGVFDEFTLEGIYKNDSNGAGGMIEKEEGEAAAANEVLGVGDLLPTRGGDLRDEAALQPTLLIKTIAPTVSRTKMEEFAKEHLGEGEGGFRWLSLSDPNPQKKYHRIGWVMLNPAMDHPEIEERGDPRDMKEDGEEGAMEVENQAPLSITHKALELINGKTIHDEQRGDFTCHVGIHEPPSMPRKKALWDLFSAPERIERDLQLAIRLVNKLDSELSELGEPVDGVTMVDNFVEELRSKGWLQPPVNAPAAKKRVKNDDMESDDGAVDEDEEEGAVDENDDNDDEELLAKKKRLDLLVEYLRRVYNFCLFCVFESDSVHELTRKCPGGHLRRPRSTLTTNAKVAAKASANGEQYPFKKQDPGAKDEEPGSPVEERKQFRGPSKTQQQLQRAFNWVKTYEEKLLQILDPDSVDIKKLGGKPGDEALEDELSKYVKQEDEARFRCKVPECTKLFKGQNFWRKHVEKRHEEFFQKIKYDVTLVNSYVLDPSHIAPSRSDATSNGHFPIKDHIPTGTPRGFNLNTFQAGFPGFPGVGAGNGQPPNMMHIAALMAQNGMNAGMWNSQPGGENDHGVGPQRRGRGPGNRASGPYDRQGGKDQRNARWNGAGRLSPPPRGAPLGRPTGPPRFGEGGAGPREAVQGRSIRSYEDLDAAGSGGAESLDY